MSDDELVTLSVEGAVARLSLSRPDKRNALSSELLASLQTRVREIAVMDGVAVCVLTGEGRSFCAGMDLRSVVSDPARSAEMLGLIAEVTIALRSLAMVTVARVNGAAIGGGCGLVAVCDIAVTHPEAKLGYPEVDLGVCPAVVAPWLVAKIGAGSARRVLLEGGTMSGVAAHQIGIVSHVVASEELDGEVEKIVGRLASAGPNALRATKSLLNELDPVGTHEMVRRGAVISAEVVAGAEAQERLGAIYKR